MIIVPLSLFLIILFPICAKETVIDPIEEEADEIMGQFLAMGEEGFQDAVRRMRQPSDTREYSLFDDLPPDKAAKFAPLKAEAHAKIKAKNAAAEAQANKKVQQTTTTNTKPQTAAPAQQVTQKTVVPATNATSVPTKKAEPLKQSQSEPLLSVEELYALYSDGIPFEETFIARGPKMMERAFANEKNRDTSKPEVTEKDFVKFYEDLYLILSAEGDQKVLDQRAMEHVIKFLDHHGLKDPEDTRKK